MIKQHILILCLGLLFKVSWAQPMTQNNGVFISGNAFDEMGIMHIISGKLYNPPYRGIENGPFLMPIDTSVRCNLTFDGVYYPQVQIQYDLYEQKVVFLLSTRANMEYIYLDYEKIDDFTIGTQPFIKLEPIGEFPFGFYQKIGKAKEVYFYAKRRKWKSEKITDTSYSVRFQFESDFYALTPNDGIKITNKKAFLKAYNNSKTLAKLLSSNGIKFKRNSLEQDITKAIHLLEVNGIQIE